MIIYRFANLIVRLLGRYAHRYDLYVSYGGGRGQPVAFARKAPNIYYGVEQDEE